MNGTDKRVSSRTAKALLAVVLAIGLCPIPAYADQDLENCSTYSEDRNRSGAESEGLDGSGNAGEGAVSSKAYDDISSFVHGSSVEKGSSDEVGDEFEDSSSIGRTEGGASSDDLASCEEEGQGDVPEMPDEGDLPDGSAKVDEGEMLEQAIAGMADEVAVDAEAADKARLVHDALAKAVTYAQDVEGLSENLRLFTAYGAVVDQVAASQGFAYAYELIMQKLDIECVVVEHVEENYAWNIVKIGDRWLHVDAAADAVLYAEHCAGDHGSECDGECYRAYSLVTDDFMAADENDQFAKKHASWMLSDDPGATPDDAVNDSVDGSIVEDEKAAPEPSGDGDGVLKNDDTLTEGKDSSQNEGAESSNADPDSGESRSEKLDDFAEAMSTGFTTADLNRVIPRTYNGTGQCQGYAKYIGRQLTGTDPCGSSLDGYGNNVNANRGWTKYGSINAAGGLRVGDFIRIYTQEGGHAAIVYSVGSGTNPEIRVTEKWGSNANIKTGGYLNGTGSLRYLNQIKNHKVYYVLRWTQDTHSHSFPVSSVSYYNDVNHTVNYGRCSCGASKASERQNCTFVWKGLKSVCSGCGAEYVYHEGDGEYVTVRNTSVFNGDNPDTGSQITIPSGLVLKVTGVKVSSWGRYVGRVAYKGKTGYAHLADFKFNGTAGKHVFSSGVCSQCGMVQVGSAPGIYKTKTDTTLYYQNVWATQRRVVKKGEQVTIIKVEPTTHNWYWGHTPDGYVVGMDQLAAKAFESGRNGSVATVADGTYLITSAYNTAFAFDIYDASKSNGAQVQLWHNNGNVAQQFKLKKNTDGTYLITNVGSGKALDASGGGLVDHTNTVQWDAHNGANQRWYVERCADGTFAFRNQNSNLYLDVNGGNVAAGTQIHQYHANQSHAQKFNLVPFGGTSSFAGSGLVVTGVNESYTFTGSAISPKPTIKRLAYALGALRVPGSGTSSGGWTYAETCTLEAGKTYLVEVDSVSKLAGNASGADMLLYDFESNRTIVEHTYSFSKSKQSKTIVPSKTGKLIMYAGRVGQCQGCASQWDGIRVYEVLEKDKDYTLSYKNNATVGSGSVVVTGKGSISGSKSIGFSIVESTKKQLVRKAGNTALDTTSSIVQEGFAKGSCDTVVVATMNGYWDALTASALAGLKRCPVLLTDPNALSSQAASEIKRLGASKVVVAGGNAAVSSRVETSLKRISCVKSVQRLSGLTAIDTGLALYRSGKGSWGKTAIVATSATFQDALSISPYAYAKKAPIFLANAFTHKLDQETLSAVKSGGFTRVVIVGGTAAVSKSVESQLRGISVVRLSGATAYETSSEIASWCVSQGMKADNMGIATGRSYYDALTGSALCGKKGAVLVLVDDANRSTIDAFVKRQKKAIYRTFVFGGEAAVSEATASYISKAIKAT